MYGLCELDSERILCMAAEFLYSSRKFMEMCQPIRTVMNTTILELLELQLSEIEFIMNHEL